MSILILESGDEYIDNKLNKPPIIVLIGKNILVRESQLEGYDTSDAHNSRLDGNIICGRKRDLTVLYLRLLDKIKGWL